MSEKCEINWTDGVSATTHGGHAGSPFHPAIRNGRRVWYWPNLTYDTEEHAYRRAVAILADTVSEAARVIKTWNVREAL